MILYYEIGFGEQTELSVGNWKTGTSLESANP